MRYRVERALIRLLARIILGRRLHVRGVQNVPATGPVLIIGNHIATCDPPLVGALVPRLDLFYMAKSESFRKRWHRFLLEGYNAFPVVRHSADRNAVRRALEVLRDGHVLVMYPEGTRSPDHRVTRPYAGVGFIARRTGAPIIPAAIWGSEDVLPKGQLIPRRADVDIVYGEPFALPERNPDGSRMTHQQSADFMMGRLAMLLPVGYQGVFGPDGTLLTDARPAA